MLRNVLVDLWIEVEEAQGTPELFDIVARSSDKMPIAQSRLTNTCSPFSLP